MISKPVDSLDLVEAVMFVEEIFGIDVPETTENFGSPDDMVDWLEVHISNQRPNKQAVALLKKLATDHNQPELGERLDEHGVANKLPLSSAKSSVVVLFEWAVSDR